MISNYPFGKKNDRPNYYYTQDVFGDGQGITGRMKKRKNKNEKKNKKKVKNIYDTFRIRKK